MDPIGAEPVDEAVRAQHGEHARLDAREPQRPAAALDELEDRRELLGALRVDEVDALEVEDHGARRRPVLRQRTDAVLERLARREEQAAVEPQHDDAGERLVAGVLVEVAEHLRAAARARAAASEACVAT